MKSLTIRIPEALLRELERESRRLGVSKSNLARERLRRPGGKPAAAGSLHDCIGDLIGSVPSLPSDLSTNKKRHLEVLIRGKKLHRR